MTKPHIFHISLFTVLLITGCADTAISNTPGPVDVPSRFESPSPQITSSPQPVVSPTVKVTVSSLISLTPAPTISPSLVTATPQNSLLRVQCLDIVQGMVTDTQAEGVLALAGYEFFPDSYLLDTETGEQIPLPRRQDEYLSSFAVSSDRRWLAYYAENQANWDDSRIIVMAADGKPVVVVSVKKSEWWSIAAWLDNEHLLINKNRREPEIRDIVVPVPLVLWNPFTGEEQELVPDYPHIYNLYPYITSWWEFSLSEAVYDPSLTLVVYPSMEGDENFGSIVLWNARTGQEVVRLPGNASYGNAPKWSPDGQRFITNYSLSVTITGSGVLSEVKAKEQELFSVSRDGEETRLTYLTEYFNEVEFGQYSWSPDGRYIAFWVHVRPDTYPNLPPEPMWTYRLAVLDTATGQVTNYCVPGSSYGVASHGGTYIIIPSAPIWSPDGSKLLVEVAHYGQGSYVAVVDIEQGSAIRVAENMIPMGWMTSEP